MTKNRMPVNIAIDLAMLIVIYYCPLNHKRVSPTSLKTEVGLTFCIGQAPLSSFPGLRAVILMPL